MSSLIEVRQIVRSLKSSHSNLDQDCPEQIGELFFVEDNIKAQTFLEEKKYRKRKMIKEY